MIQPLGTLIDYLYFHSKNGNDDPTRDSFGKNYMSLVEIKDFSALIDNKPFFYQPVKNKQEAYEKLMKMSRNNDYTKGHSLDYLYHQKHFKLIGIDLSRQTNMSISQQIDFLSKLEEDDGTKKFLSLKSNKKLLQTFFRFIRFNRII